MECMASLPIPHLTVEQYLGIERANEFRSEYLKGEMFAMSGASTNHVRIVRNTLRQLDEQLDNSACEVFATDHRVYSEAADVLTYPDIVVACPPYQYHDKQFDTFTDVTVIIEVLSPSTKNYDRGEKFLFYRAMPSFCEYVLLAQDTIRAEHHTRQPDGSWLFREYTAASDVIALQSISCQLRLETLYKRVAFPSAS